MKTKRTPIIPNHVGFLSAQQNFVLSEWFQLLDEPTSFSYSLCGKFNTETRLHIETKDQYIVQYTKEGHFGVYLLVAAKMDK